MKDLIRILISLFVLTNLFPSDLHSKKSYSYIQILNDLNIMDSILRTVHPDPFFYIEENKFIQRKEEISHIISQKDSFSISEAYKILAPFISILKDGHSLLLTPNNSIIEGYNAKVFPIKIKILDNNIYAIYDFYKKTKFPEKTRITKINNTCTETLLNNILKLYPLENSKEMFYTTIEKDFYSLLYCYLNLKEDLVLSLDKPSLDKYETKLISYSYIKKSLGINEKKMYDFQLNTTSDTAFISLKNFLPIPQFYDFIHNTFAEIKKKNINFIKIDVRGNKGGASYAVDSLMTYLCNRPYKLYDSVYVKISNPVLKKLREKKSLLINKIDTNKVNQLLKLSPPYIYPVSNINYYDGKLEILIDKETYSGASTFANVIKVMKRGNIVGDSEAKNIYFGDFLFFQLPNTKMLFSVSTRKFIEYSGTRKANRVGNN